MPIASPAIFAKRRLRTNLFAAHSIYGRCPAVTLLPRSCVFFSQIADRFDV